MIKFKFRLNPSAGMVVPTMVLIMITLTVSALALANFSINHFSRVNTRYFATNSLLAAEAGAEQTLYELNENSSFGGYPTEQEFFNDPSQGRGTYQTQVLNGNLANEKIIISTGRIYQRAASTTPDIERKVRLTVVGTNSGDSYAVQAGSGGLVMTGSATIANGPLHINGGITLSGAARIGSQSNPVDVSVANYRCPLSGSSGYPALCASSQGDPISANIYSNRIYGDVCATHQQIGSFMSHSGLQAGCTAPLLDLPTHDRTSVTANTTTTQTGSQAGCGGATTKQWPANLRINGNVTIGGSCTLTINGNVWISGNLVIAGAARIFIANSAATAPTLVIDGSGGVNLGGSGRIIPNNTNVAALLVTYYAAASCSPNCASLTGAELKSSENATTVIIAGGSQAPGTLFYARWSKAIIAGSGTTGGIVAQKVELSGAGNVVFGTQLSTGTSVWSIKNYQQVFN